MNLWTKVFSGVKQPIDKLELHLKADHEEPSRSQNKKHKADENERKEICDSLHREAIKRYWGRKQC